MKTNQHTNPPTTEEITRPLCTTRHHCPEIEKILGYKPYFLGYVPRTCNIDYKGYKMLYKVETRFRTFLLWTNTTQEAAETIQENEMSHPPTS